MKNFSKMSFVRLFGIIAIIAVVGLLFACELDPADQVKIKISGMPAGANGKYAFIGLYDGDKELVAYSTAFKRISSGNVTCEMRDDGGEWGKEGSYYIQILIYVEERPASVDDYIYLGNTSSRQAIVKGDNGPFEISLFTPDIVNTDWGNEEPTTDEYGTYEGEAADAANKEVIFFNKTSLTITEKVKTTDVATGDYLNFTITKWEDEKPSQALITAGYVNGFKFTGKITAQQGYVPSGKTAPNFIATDVNNTECWMFIYFKGTGSNITFVRSPFSKTGNVNAGVVTSDSGTNRVYTKK